MRRLSWLVQVWKEKKSWRHSHSRKDNILLVVLSGALPALCNGYAPSFCSSFAEVCSKSAVFGIQISSCRDQCRTGTPLTNRSYLRPKHEKDSKSRYNH